MKKSILLIAAMASYAVQAQLVVPELSPPGRIIQKVGFTTMEVYYERPAARGRTSDQVFGQLVPYGKVWRTGAGNCTTISFDTDVVINDKTIGKGKYALFTIPEKSNWTIILNTDTLAYGAYKYDAAKDVVRVTVPSRRTERFYEALTIDIDFIPNDARIYISWLNTQVFFNVSTGIDKQILSFIKDNLINRKSDDPRLYESAIAYYRWHQQDRNVLMNLIDRGIELESDRRWYYGKVEELMIDKRYEDADSAARKAIKIIRNSSETPERKTELIRDFEIYLEQLDELRRK